MTHTKNLLCLAFSLAFSGYTLFSQVSRTDTIVRVTGLKTAMPAGCGNADERVVGFRISSGMEGLRLTSVTFDLEGTTQNRDLGRIRLYSSGQKPRLIPGESSLYGTTHARGKKMNLQGSFPLPTGDTHFWITSDIKPDAREGHRLGGRILSVAFSDGTSISVDSIVNSRTILPVTSLLFTPGDEGSKSYRIPALVTAPDGSLVTATDRRWTGSQDLPSHIDVVVRRSTDGGRTWGNTTVIAGQDTDMGFGDPALVVNRRKGELVCLFAADRGLYNSTPESPIRIFQSISRDNGVTWTKPAEITEYLYGTRSIWPFSRTWQAAFVSSGAAAQLTGGRLMAVLAVREKPNGPISNYVMYSDDDAGSWKVSPNCACKEGDEAKVAELPNGTVLMSIRHRGHRLFTRSKDQGITWDTPVDQPAIMDPFCNGDLIRFTGNDDPARSGWLLHSIPFSDKRMNVSVLLSPDQGVTWPWRKTIYEGPSAYSALSVLPDGTVGIYYEVGEYETYQMYFSRFSIDWLISSF